MYNLEEICQKRLLVFDMDGTLFDTAESNYCAYRDAAKEWGYEIVHDKFMEVFVGKNYKEFLPVLGVSGKDVLKKIHDHKKENYRSYIGKIKKNEALFKVMDVYKQKSNGKIALATTASKENTNDILDYFKVKSYFDHVIAQEDVSKLKPDPECYIRVMEIMGTNPENTMIFEDSEVGIQAAIASGADYVRVCDFVLS